MGVLGVGKWVRIEQEGLSFGVVKLVMAVG